MSIIGYYDGATIRVNKSMQINQKVIIIPIESDMDLNQSAAGGLHNFANLSLIEQEEDSWRKAAVRKHVQE